MKVTNNLKFFKQPLANLKNLVYNEHKTNTYRIDPAVHLLPCLTKRTSSDYRIYVNQKGKI